MSPSGPSATATVAHDPKSPAFVRAFGGHLEAQGRLDELAKRRAERAQHQSGERFDLVLTRLGLIPEATLAEALASFLGLEIASSADLAAAPVYTDRLQHKFLKANLVLPIMETPDRLVVAMADPFNEDAAALLGFLFERKVERRIAPAGDLERAIQRLYGAGAGKTAYRAPTSGLEDGNEDDVRRLQDLASEAPVIRLVHDLIARAVEADASDIHIEPREDGVRVRMRIDGILHTTETLPLSLKAAVSSRVKIMASLNIAERRLPQDGRIRTNVRGREIDLRVSTMPTLNGEGVVLRILDRSAVALSFPSLGFGGVVLSGLSRLLEQPNGMILVTGPTGSGKTTTLYTALASLNTPERKIFTVEDPIEYQIAGINQIQVQPKIGLTFAHALRSILRQDPDIIMIGEIRDLETAQIAIQAALTGHLVLSTVHTNSAAATITRLLDMGVEDYLLASSVTGVLAQRLVRRLCEACAVAVDDNSPLFRRLAADLPGDETRLSPRRKTGCAACRNTGFSGRTTVGELLAVDDRVRDAILKGGGSERAIETAAIEGGMIPMARDGILKAARGETTIEEVLRVTRID